MIFQNFLTLKLIPLFGFLNIATFMFFSSLIGIIWNLKNILIMLLCVELMFVSINLQFLFVAAHTTYYCGYLYSLINVVLAATESVIGLTIIILLYKITDTLDYDSLNHLRY